MRLNKDFFKGKDTLTLAKELIGKTLTHKTSKGIIQGIINETEAYTQTDKACHCYGGKKTKRTSVMFKDAGHFYVYFTYGMYHCCNVVTGPKDKGEAVLIRSIIPQKGQDIMLENRPIKNIKHLSNGPGKLCQAFAFNRSHSGINLLSSNPPIYLEDLGYKPIKINNSKRIGISKDKDLLWRFIATEFIS